MRHLGSLSDSSRFDGLRTPMFLSALAASFCLFGCSSNASTGGSDSGPTPVDGGDGGIEPDGGADAGPDAGVDGGPNGDPSTTYPAPHPAMPQVITFGGPVLANPNVIAVTFAGDDPTLTAALEDFLQRVGATAYYAANTLEYGVGAATAGPAIALTETAPATTDFNAIESWLAGKLNGNDPSFPTVDANTLFVLIYPAGTTITVSSGGVVDQSCQTFGSYHSDITLDSAHGGAKVPYVVLPRCANFNGLTDTAAATVTLSLSLLNAVTDPEVADFPAWSQTDTDHLAWNFAVGGGEICNLCLQEQASFLTLTEIPYTVLRCWSNAAAAAGHDPCAPAPSGVPYFNALPVLLDKLDVSGGVMTPAVRIPVGASKSIAADLFSDAATAGPISVLALDYAALTGKPPVLTLSLDTATGLNGQHLNLTISVPQAPIQPAPFFLVSKSGGVTHVSVGLAGN
jgi:hypothetical protein